MKTAHLFFVTIMGFLVLMSQNTEAQVIGESEEIGFNISLQSINLPEMPAVHSYAYGLHGDDILIVGGRIDGLHARQPFAAFPLASNNQQLIVVNPTDRQVWTASLNSFSTSIREQFQSTNMNFYQSADTLYLIGGYAFSPTANNHVMFPASFLTLTLKNIVVLLNVSDPPDKSKKGATVDN